jgi:L-malate glycosyltransferase
VKIAVVYDAVYPFSKGGAERRYYELALRLSRAGHDVHWYGMRYWSGPAVIRNGGITFHGVCRAIPLYTRDGRRSIPQALYFGLATLRIVGARFDVIDCCGFPFFSIFAARVAVALRGGQLVSTWHEVWGREYWHAYLGRLGGVGSMLERMAARIPSHVIAVSRETASRLEHLMHPRCAVTVLPNGVDTVAIASVFADDKPCDLVYAGRLCDFKDVELLLTALLIMTEERPELTCRIVGDGPHRSALEAFTCRTGIADRVEFSGFLPTADQVYVAIAAARVFVLPSRREGFGIVALEANALGVPVVVVAHPDNCATELIGRENGFVVVPDPHALAAVLGRLLDEPAGIRADACKAVARRYDWDAMAARYASLLEEVAA